MAGKRRSDYGVEFPLPDFLPERNSTRTVTEPAREVAVLTECGAAAAMVVPDGSVRDVDARSLRNNLKQSGVPLMAP